jgi:thioredoxin reductase (NADPH)
MKRRDPFDILIIGGGMAGMTAAIYAARANRSCAVLESGVTGGLANFTYTVENYPSYITVHGMDLMQKVRDQVDHLGVRVEEICEIESLDFLSHPKRIETEEAVYESGAVIVATGRKPLVLDLPTECAQVHYCAICDGASYKGKKVLIVGGGNSAFDEGLYLQQLGVAHITLVEAMDRLFAAEATRDSLFKGGNVECRLQTRVRDLIMRGQTLTAAVLENTATGERCSVDVDGIFVFLGQKPNTDMFRGILPLDDAGYIPADAHMRTGVSGVFSAGDVNAKRFRQLVTAASDGAVAALMADEFLRSGE